MIQWNDKVLSEATVNEYTEKINNLVIASQPPQPEISPEPLNPQEGEEVTTKTNPEIELFEKEVKFLLESGYKEYKYDNYRFYYNPQDNPYLIEINESGLKDIDILEDETLSSETNKLFIFEKDDLNYKLKLNTRIDKIIIESFQS